MDGRAPVVGIIGPGRAGIGLGLGLVAAGHRVLLHGRRRVPTPASLALTDGPANAPPPWIAEVQIVVLALPDDAITPYASVLARVVSRSHIVLHLSGVYGQEALAPLAVTGAALGSLHPLQTIAEPERAPERLRGAWAAVEGMPVAVAAAVQLARDIGMHPFRIASEAKALYHAGAVFASNYFVVVEAVARRLLRQAGLPEQDAWSALQPLIEGTLDNLRRAHPIGALTGPVARGDGVTVRRHLSALSPDDRVLYRILGEVALQLARQRGLDSTAVARVAEALATDPPPARRGEPKT